VITDYEVITVASSFNSKQCAKKGFELNDEATVITS